LCFIITIDICEVIYIDVYDLILEEELLSKDKLDEILSPERMIKP